ncbi:hypothetical protein AB4455_04735 [Vibrio sp. 10N.261.46.E12]|uniref:hypothetical protein n=1 Tax=unclassified Vibrio TaxID=2614977 RepID=UPI0009772CB5|nr:MULTISPECIES: hypothetical protein [unclassified Vibrio]OMO36246.1 hypothetical protein BH584_05570 [Vibrio sp. 10N.261.45.E1]PMJ34402.1 hypothetical protein BCU27_02965 [Vibrio sp. 10N.286.45.B6]PML86773.1 hypothetical protein BCT66_00670 [Vibrio sp. 10N.261.49.E11]PMM76773.1 hypothetical protein BCT48_24545 [Vibrio sp. 10N.261.46.F12]PMM81859.1 hypothetical protein BCT46_15750 [Vibrio sp. 10N.261.46.E8]
MNQTNKNVQVNRGGLQYLSRHVAHRHNVSLGTLVLLDAVREGNTFNEIAKMYGVEECNRRSIQFISDLVKNSNKKTTTPLFLVTNLNRRDLDKMGLDVTVGRHPRWLSLTSYGMKVLKEMDKTLYTNI